MPQRVASACFHPKLLSVISAPRVVLRSGCVRGRTSKNAGREASPYSGAADGKQPLGSTGSRQLEEFVAGARRGGTAPQP